MPESIPPRGSIPPHARREKQEQFKTINTASEITRGLGIRIGIGADNRPVIKRSSASSGSYRIQGKPTAQNKLDKRTLEKLLVWGQQEEQRCIDVLKRLSAELPEYDEMLEKLGKLQQVLEQIKRQLAAGK